MGVSQDEIQVIATNTGRKVPEIPTFRNEQAFNAWWAGVTIRELTPRHEADGERVGVVQGDGNLIKRFRTFAAAHMWTNQLHAIKLHHGTDIRHNIPGYGIIHYPNNPA